MQQFEVAIIGSGPAGAMAAYHLAKEGISVILIDKENLPRYKTCGGGLVYRGKKMLPFDLGETAERSFHTVDVFFSGTDIHLTSKRDEAIISMVMREDFDLRIVNEAVQLGATLLTGQTVKGLRFENGIVIELATEEIKVDKVIAADGALSPIAKMAGWSNETRHLIPALEYEVEVNTADFERLKEGVRFDVDFVPAGYAWSFPKKNHLSLGIASTKRKRVDLKAYYRKYLIELGITEIISEKAHGFQIPLSPRTDGFVKNNVFLTGDAAGFADPITAEGISNALYSGKLVAQAIVEAKKSNVDAGLEYQKLLEEKLLPELKTVHYLAKLFYEQPKLRMFFLKKSGNQFCEYMTDIFMGDKYYPKNLRKTVANKIKESVFA